MIIAMLAQSVNAPFHEVHQTGKPQLDFLVLEQLLLV